MAARGFSAFRAEEFHGLHNTSEVEVDIVTALAEADLDEIRFLLTDEDGNILAVQPLRQSLGQGIITLSDGSSVARIAPGDTFTSGPTELPVPLASPDEGVCIPSN